jgi:hypothetical protein
LGGRGTEPRQPYRVGGKAGACPPVPQIFVPPLSSHRAIPGMGIFYFDNIEIFYKISKHFQHTNV